MSVTAGNGIGIHRFRSLFLCYKSHIHLLTGGDMIAVDYPYFHHQRIAGGVGDTSDPDDFTAHGVRCCGGYPGGLSKVQRDRQRQRNRDKNFQRVNLYQAEHFFKSIDGTARVCEAILNNAAEGRFDLPPANRQFRCLPRELIVPVF